jgi:hypothetical protein
MPTISKESDRREMEVWVAPRTNRIRLEVYKKWVLAREKESRMK